MLWVRISHVKLTRKRVSAESSTGFEVAVCASLLESFCSFISRLVFSRGGVKMERRSQLAL